MVQNSESIYLIVSVGSGTGFELSCLASLLKRRHRTRLVRSNSRPSSTEIIGFRLTKNRRAYVISRHSSGAAEAKVLFVQTKQFVKKGPLKDKEAPSRLA